MHSAGAIDTHDPDLDCGHCLWGETPILMADGTTRPLASLRAGDAIFGTLGEGGQRRYGKTQVLARWSVIKRAFRVLLGDGTEIVAGGGHRLLTTQGWKLVAGEQGADAGPHLTRGDRLLGTGAFPQSPAQDLEYRRGYPATVNTEREAIFAARVGERVFGAANVLTDAEPSMGGEDFSYYTERLPGCFVGLGMRDPEQDAIYSVHHPKFKADESALPLGTALHVAFAFASLDEMASKP